MSWEMAREKNKMKPINTCKNSIIEMLLVRPSTDTSWLSSKIMLSYMEAVALMKSIKQR